MADKPNIFSHVTESRLLSSLICARKTVFSVFIVIFFLRRKADRPIDDEIAGAMGL